MATPISIEHQRGLPFAPGRVPGMMIANASLVPSRI